MNEQKKRKKKECREKRKKEKKKKVGNEKLGKSLCGKTKKYGGNIRRYIVLNKRHYRVLNFLAVAEWSYLSHI